MICCIWGHVTIGFDDASVNALWTKAQMVEKSETARKLWRTGINNPFSPQFFTEHSAENKCSEEIYPQENGIYPQVLGVLCTSRGKTGRRISRQADRSPLRRYREGGPDHPAGWKDSYCRSPVAGRWIANPCKVVPFWAERLRRGSRY